MPVPLGTGEHPPSAHPPSYSPCASPDPPRDLAASGPVPFPHPPNRLLLHPLFLLSSTSRAAHSSLILPPEHELSLDLPAHASGGLSNLQRAAPRAVALSRSKAASNCFGVSEPW